MGVLSRFFHKPKQVPITPIEPPVDIGLVDAHLRGWFAAEKGELFTDFPISPGDVVADIGCGDGGNAEFCARLGARLILADISAESLARAVARVSAHPSLAGVESYVTNSDPLPIADGVATRIVCTEVIEHVDSPARLMSELARIGAPGARYLLACPDPDSEAIQKPIAHPSYFAKPNHIRVIKHDEFARYVEDAGLIIEARHSYGFFWSMWWAFFWACPGHTNENKHPLLESWSQTWATLLTTPHGTLIKNTLDDLLPKSQIIIARKP